MKKMIYGIAICLAIVGMSLSSVSAVNPSDFPNHETFYIDTYINEMVIIVMI